MRRPCAREADVSFILDALRKSEHERQRQTGPGLAEVPITPQKPRTNVWATAAIALLLVNLIAVGVLLLRRAQHQEQAAPNAATATVPAGAEPSAAQSPTVAALANPTLQPVAPGVPVTQGAAPAAAVPAPSPAPRMSAPPESAARNPLADEVGGGESGLEPEIAGRAASVPAGPPAVSSAQPSRRGSVVYAPIPEAGDAPYSGPPAVSTVEPSAPPAVSRTAPAAEALPGADEITARGGMPELHLDLHVYANVPAQRFIFVNSRKYREGDTMQEGPLVEQITPDGAVLNFRGSRFKLGN
jgi:general secretion pathway protein B